MTKNGRGGGQMGMGKSEFGVGVTRKKNRKKGGGVGRKNGWGRGLNPGDRGSRHPLPSPTTNLTYAPHPCMKSHGVFAKCIREMCHVTWL